MFQLLARHSNVMLVKKAAPCLNDGRVAVDNDAIHIEYNGYGSCRSYHAIQMSYFAANGKRDLMNTNPVNLALRFFLELVMLVVVAFWGYHRFPGWQGVAAAISFPVAAATVWGVFRIPNDPRQAPVAIPGPLRLLLEWALFAWAVWALADLGYETLAWLLAGMLVAHYLVSYDRTMSMLRNRPYNGFVK